MINEEQLEKEIQDKGLNAPRLTPDLIDSKIKDTYYHVVPNTTLTICVITLLNGFQVTGESAAASLKNFNEEIGRKIAFDKARDKIWQLEGYLLKEELYEDNTSTYIIRLKEEQIQLEVKIKDLKTFIDKEPDLDKNIIDDLEEQYYIMEKYNNILIKRLNNLNN